MVKIPTFLQDKVASSPETVCSCMIFFMTFLFTPVENASAEAKLSHRTLELIPGMQQVEEGSLDPDQVIIDFTNIPLGMDPPELTAGLEEIIAKYPQTGFAYSRLASHYATTNQCSEMFRIGELAQKNCPNNIFAFNDVGLAYLQCGNAERGVASLKRALEINPDSGARYNLANFYCQQGRYEECMNESKDYIQKHEHGTDNSEVHTQMLMESYNNVGLSFVYTGRLEESLQWFEEALKRDPKNTRIKDNYQWARGQIKK